MDKHINNTDYIGPGVWFTIHLLAKNATDYNSNIRFVKYMKLLSKNYPCLKCRKHIEKYLLENPINIHKKLYNKDKINIYMFKYTWYFHNDVNSRLNKQLLPFNEVYNMYYNFENYPCNYSCNSDNSFNSDNSDNNNYHYNNKKFILKLPNKLKYISNNNNNYNNNVSLLNRN